MHKLICIICPKGCHLQVDENNKVTGNSCKRGEIYAINELTSPTRRVTSTIVINNGEINRLPVVTSKPVPKNMIFEVMKEINHTSISAPVKTGDVVIKNILNLGVDIKATRTIKINE